MNLDPNALPLPRPSAVRFHRRRRIPGLFLAPTPLRRFAAAAESLHSASHLPDADAIASTARLLLARFPGFRHAPPVHLRLRCMTALRTMSREPDWSLDSSTVERIAAIQAYAACNERLVPDDVPVVGGLDDALLVDLAWPTLSAEITDYLDFRRARTEQARRLGIHPDRMRFTREDWLEVRMEEHAWRQHQRTQGLSHYTANPVAPRFLVH